MPDTTPAAAPTPTPEVQQPAVTPTVPSAAPAEKPSTAGSGIIDRDFVGRKREPHFQHVGSMGGQNVVQCDQCGSLVRESGTSAHVVFHGILNGVADYNGVQA